ncbi:MAG: hypothetical protein FWC91_13610, partial [Defluviitaleaceae bacterium]|nr:hypothetical protein [Defluviitaleaceae bacterium]
MYDKNEDISKEGLVNINNSFDSMYTSFDRGFRMIDNPSFYSNINIPNYYLFEPFLSNKNIEKLTNQLEEKTNEIKKLRDELQSKEKNDELLLKLQEAKKEQRKIVEIKYLLTRLHPMASSVLLESNNEILSSFSKNESMEMTVMSIDIRKSTDLMLKAITPDAYAEFISGLTEG